MVLSRKKRINAGKAFDTPQPSGKPKGSKKAVSKARSVSVVSQGSSRSKRRTPAVSKRAKSASGAQSTQPASLRRQENISTASPST